MVSKTLSFASYTSATGEGGQVSLKTRVLWKRSGKRRSTRTMVEQTVEECA